MPYELPDDRRADRVGVIWRWVSMALVLLLVALVAYLAFVGYTGSDRLVHPALTTDCRTPATAYGWTYEPINYDPAGDAAIAALPDPSDCAIPLARAEDELVTSDGVRIAGWYIPSREGTSGGRPTVVLAHDAGQNKSSMLEYAALLHDRYDLLLVDLRGHGQSQAAASTGGLLERLDLRAALDWLEARKAPSAIALFGVSLGGSAALNAAANDERVTAVVIDSPYATLANAEEARLAADGYPLALPGAWSVLFGALIRTGQDMSGADPVQAAERLDNRPMLLIAGGRDREVGSGDADELASAARDAGADVELETCAAAGHAGAIGACADDYRDWVLGFLARTIGSGS